MVMGLASDCSTPNAATTTALLLCSTMRSVARHEAAFFVKAVVCRSPGLRVLSRRRARPASASPYDSVVVKAIAGLAPARRTKGIVCSTIAGPIPLGGS